MNVEKLDYIDKFLLAMKFKTQSVDSISQKENYAPHLHWVSLDKQVNFLVKKKIKNILDSEDSYFSKNLKLEMKKLNILQIYMNLLLVTFCLRYIEIIIKVKRGGFYFSFVTFSLFYLFNKYYKNYKTTRILKVLTIDPIKYIEKLKEEQFLKNKETHLTKIKLNKYWKEPMSWH